jgi:hypothetical protein
MEYRHFVLARFFEHIEPIDRGSRYEDPLNEVLESAGIGRVTGGGSQLTSDRRWLAREARWDAARMANARHRQRTRCRRS